MRVEIHVAGRAGSLFIEYTSSAHDYLRVNVKDLLGRISAVTGIDLHRLQLFHRMKAFDQNDPVSIRQSLNFALFITR